MMMESVLLEEIVVKIHQKIHRPKGCRLTTEAVFWASQYIQENSYSLKKWANLLK
jgi:hypothetical protein